MNLTLARNISGSKILKLATFPGVNCSALFGGPPAATCLNFLTRISAAWNRTISCCFHSEFVSYVSTGDVFLVWTPPTAADFTPLRSRGTHTCLPSATHVFPSPLRLKNAWNATNPSAQGRKRTSVSSYAGNSLCTRRI